MDFDEYEYLEKAVEPAELPKDSNGASSGRGSSKRRSDEDSYKRDERSKRSRDHESERSEKSDRSRSEREKSRDVERSERHRDQDRDRDRDRERGDRRRSSRDIDRDYEKERDRDRGRSKDRRSHSRSRDYHTDRDREGSRVREEMEHGVRDYDREYRHSREKREKKEEVAAEPEADPERDQRTVFAYQGCWSPGNYSLEEVINIQSDSQQYDDFFKISLKADERDVYEFFSRAGKVRDVRLIMDRNSRRSKGVGYIEFYDAMSVPMAITLTGQPLLGQPVMVKPSEAEKNLVQSTSAASGTGGLMGPYSGGARRLYVGNLHPHITESQLRQVFEPFGVVEMVQLPTEPDTGNCKGFGFVQYAKLEDARAAQQSLNGTLEMAGRYIKVMAVTDQMSAQDAVVAPGELDDDDGGGLSLTARSRALLMQKLDRTGTVSSITAAAVAPVLNVLPTAPAAAPIVPGLTGMVGLPNPGLGATTALGATAVEPIGAPTDCLLLKNMFDPRTETDPEFDLDIKDEVQSECSKFGVVKHISVDKNSAGHVYLRFDSTKSAISAQKALHARWFAGKMITTVFLTPQVYEGKFPDSK